MKDGENGIELARLLGRDLVVGLSASSPLAIAASSATVPGALITVAILIALLGRVLCSIAVAIIAFVVVAIMVVGGPLRSRVVYSFMRILARCVLMEVGLYRS